MRWLGRLLIAAALAPGVILAGATLAGHPLLRGVDTCPCHALTGLWCPLCGGTRATGALLRGDLSTALGYNPLAIVIDAWLMSLVLRIAYRSWQSRHGERPNTPLVGWAEGVTLMCTLVIFFVVRNLPGAWPYLGPLLGPPF